MGRGQREGEEGRKGFRAWMKARVNTRIIAGIVVLVPVVVTFLVLNLVFQWLDGFAQPPIKRVLHIQTDIPGLGIVLTLVLIWLAGLLASNVLGRRLIGHGDDLLARLPIVGSIYSPVKQFIETLVSNSQNGFRQVVMAEYPSEGLWILGFATGEVQLDAAGRMGRCVFVPTSPNPATGWMVIFPPEKVRETPLSVEEAMQLIVSGGIVIPKALRNIGAYGFTAEAASAHFDAERKGASSPLEPQPDGLPAGHKP